MNGGDWMTFAHGLSGPLDALLELGLPLAIFAGLYWWASRKSDSTKK